jgi:integrase
VRWGYVVRNVADLIDSPKPKPTDMKFWTPAQLRAFLKTVGADRLSAMWVLFATTGMRRGEVAGLRWVDVDFDAPRVLARTPRVTVDREIVVSEPKTTRSRRSVSLDPGILAALTAWREHQDGERSFVGRGYIESGLVFTMPDGSAVSPHNITDWFESWARKAGLPRIRLHDYADIGTTTISATAMPRRPCVPACRPRSLASASGTPTSPLRSTPTPMCSLSRMPKRRCLSHG